MLEHWRSNKNHWVAALKSTPAGACACAVVRCPYDPLRTTPIHILFISLTTLSRSWPAEHPQMGDESGKNYNHHHHDTHGANGSGCNTRNKTNLSMRKRTEENEGDKTKNKV
uniref:Uncharacterized protein n=1 Tax=Trypanosoma congolense (strain IL3000) TaxID=1068625 RepID=G0UZX2_TRYCI|nr:hypothetical protein, unlikely [Trypanosoma congolense IL3000]